MDLLTPNIAYIILLGAILFGLLAVFTPGTGIFEIGAVFCFVLTGYAIYSLSVNWQALGILLLSVVSFAYAVRINNKFLLGFSIFLLVIGSAFLFVRDGEWFSVNPILAFISSGVLAALSWMLTVNFIKTLASRPAHDLETLIGQTGEARTAIHNDGSAYVDGELWSARSEKKIASGSSIRVTSREGFTLVVEKIE